MSPSVPTRSVNTLTQRATGLEDLLEAQDVELRRHGLILNAPVADARAELLEVVNELVEELAELAAELAED